MGKTLHAIAGAALITLGLVGGSALPAQASGTTCATGGLCAVGDTGPGGGVVFYVSTTPFDCGPDLTQPLSCNFLEAAGSEWVDTASTYPWAPTMPSRNVPGLTDTSTATDAYNAIGAGLSASNLIVTEYGAGTNYAAGVARAFTNTSGTPQNDWYLPTGRELLQLCKYANSGAQGADLDPCVPGTYRSGFSGANQNAVYWTSSEYNAGEAWFEYFDIGGLDRVPKTGGLGENRVRPIRAGLGVAASSNGGGVGGSGGSGGAGSSSGTSSSSLSSTGQNLEALGLTGLGALVLTLAGAGVLAISRRVAARR